MAYFRLWLVDGGEAPVLQRTVFCHESLPEVCRAVRGKSEGAYPGHGSFQASAAVQAMTILMLRSAAAAQRGGEDAPVAILAGQGGSPVASLDYALSKQPRWLPICSARIGRETRWPGW